MISWFLATLVDLVQSHSTNQKLQQNTTEDYIDSFSSGDDDDEEMELFEEEMQSKKSSDSCDSSVTSPIGVESVQGNGTFSLINKQRFFLNMFMFAFMFFGPGKLLFGSKDGTFLFLCFQYYP